MLYFTYTLAQLYIYIFNLFNTVSYIRISSGSCETHGMRMITSKPLCGAAAWNLGLSATVSSYQDSWRPYGCTHGGKFVTTLQLKSPRDAPDVYATYGSSDCSDIIDCICTTQGMNMHFNFVIYGLFIVVIFKS